jgi:class 3 adenylate cyclase
MASRIEQLNKRWHSQLIISKEVFNELDAGVNAAFMPQKPAKVKGINRPVLLYVYNEGIKMSKILTQ